MLIKDLPKEIYDLVKIRSDEYNATLGRVFKLDKNTKLTSCFTFSETIEGGSFWKNIYYGDYSEFYKLYPFKEITIDNIITSKSTTVYYATIKNKKVKITIEYE